MINEKYHGPIAILCLSLSIILILSTLFMTPKNNVTKDASNNKELVLNKDKVTEIDIEIKDSDWNWLIENASKEEYRSANITINGEKFYNVGIRPKGNSSLSSVISDPNSDRFSFKIDFGQYIKGQTYHGYEKLALNNMMSDATYMKEYLSYGLYDFLGVPTPEYSYSNIKFNGKEWGLYLAIETLEENFLQREFGTIEGNLYKPETMNAGGGMAKGGNGFQGGGNQREGMGNQANQNGNGDMNPPNGGVGQGPGNPPDGMAFPGGNNQGGGMGLPEGNNVTDNKENQDKGQGENLPQGNNAKNPGQNMAMGRGAQGGANLKYIDDKISSYSVLRESAVLKTTTDKDFEKVITMMKNLNEGQNLEEYLDVEEILKYFAVNTFLVNLDSYSGGMYHNYYLYEKDGKFSILPWDLNMSFAGFSRNMGSQGEGSQSVINFPIDSPVTGNLEDAPLIGKLLEVKEYKELYHSYLEKIAKEYFNSGVFENTVTEVDKLISDYVKSDATAFYTYEEYKKSIPELLTFGKDRTLSVTSQLSGEQPSTTYGTIESKVNLQSLGTMGMGGKNGNQQVAGNKGNNVNNGNNVGIVNNGNNERNNNNGNINNNGNDRNNINQNQGDQNMPSQENIMKAMEIIKDTDINNLTAEQKEKLKALGVDEAMLNAFKNMGQGQGGRAPMNGPVAASVSRNSVYLGLGLLAMLSLGVVFVGNFKRKKNTFSKK